MSSDSEVESLLVVEGLEVAYQQVILALRGVTLQVPRGSVVALLGANGAGKTTTLRAISRLLAAARGAVLGGTIRYDGRPMPLSPRSIVRAGVVQVLEGRHCFRHLTVEENLMCGALGPSRRLSDARRDLQRVYELFPRLSERRRLPCGVLSGGEQQMVAIGRAWMAKPQLVLLDEPSMGLAPNIVEDIFACIGRLNERDGVSFLVAEQNAAVALRYAHFGYVLEDGRVALRGTARELRDRNDIREHYLGGSRPQSSKQQLQAGRRLQVAG